MVTDDDDMLVNYGITTDYNHNVGADYDIENDGDDDDNDDDDDDLYALIMLHCNFFFTSMCLSYLLSFVTFLSAIIGFLNSTVVMRLCDPNGEIAYIYDLTV